MLFNVLDMYSSSKGCVEIMSSSFRRSFLQDEGSFALANARAGNVIGGGDWALDRLVPDWIRSINDNKDIEIKHYVCSKYARDNCLNNNTNTDCCKCTLKAVHFFIN